MPNAGTTVNPIVASPVGGGIGYLDVVLSSASSGVTGGKFKVGSGPEEPIPMNGYQVTSGKMTVSFTAPSGYIAPGNVSVGVNPNQTVTITVTFGT